MAYKMQAEAIEMTAEDYHAHPAIGSSMIEDFIKSRWLYFRKYIAKDLEPNEPSAAMVLGTLFHKMLLEPLRYVHEVAAPMPKFELDEENVTKDGARSSSKVTKYYKAKAAEYREKHQGKLIPTDEQAEALEQMHQAAKRNDVLRKLLHQDGAAEFSIFWNCPVTNLRLKCRVDWLSAISLDVKTTADPSPQAFARIAENLGYYRKHHHYLQGIAAYTGEPTPTMLYAAVQNVAPFNAALYDLEDLREGSIDLGAKQREKALVELAGCIERQEWQDWWTQGAVTLRRPRYATIAEEYRL